LIPIFPIPDQIIVGTVNNVFSDLITRWIIGSTVLWSKLADGERNEERSTGRHGRGIKNSALVQGATPEPLNRILCECGTWVMQN